MTINLSDEMIDTIIANAYEVRAIFDNKGQMLTKAEVASLSQVLEVIEVFEDLRRNG
jgi:hypothetical protein